MTVFNKVWFRAYQPDEGTDFDDSGGGGGGGGGDDTTTITCATHIYLPSTTLADQPSFNVDVMWVSNGANNALQEADNVLQSVYPTWDGVSGVWNLLYGSSELGSFDADTWYLLQLDIVNNLNGTFDTTLTVDGVVLAADLGASVPFDAHFTHLGFGNNADGTGTEPIYFDSPSKNGTTIDDFEGGTLAAWDEQEGSPTISTDVAVSGTHSLKCDATALGYAYVLKYLS